MTQMRGRRGSKPTNRMEPLTREEMWKREIRIRISDTVENQSCMYSPATVRYLPVVDAFRLVNQRPETLSIVKWEDGACRTIYTTHQDIETSLYFQRRYLEPARLNRSLCISFLHNGDEYALAVHVPINSARALRYRQIKAPHLENSIESIAARNAGRTLLRDFVGFYKARQPSDHHTITNREFSIDESIHEREATGETSRRVVEALRPVIRDALAGNSHDSLLLRDNAPFRNFFIGPMFSVSGPRRGRFPYTSQIIVPPQQQEQIVHAVRDGAAPMGRKYISDSVLSRILMDFEKPFGPNARAIVDASFSSGTIEFAHEKPGELRDSLAPFDETSGNFAVDNVELKSPENQDDVARRAAERLIYGQLRAGRLMCVPVHVGGIAYMTAITFAPRSSRATSWMYPFQFYSIMPLIAARLRLGVRRAFLNMVAEDLGKTIRRFMGEAAVAEVNSAWRRLAGFFPYALPQMHLADDSIERAVDLPGIGSVRISLETNPNACFADPMDFDRLEVNEILEVCGEVAEIRKRAKLEQLLRETTDAVHEISNLLVPPISDLEWVENIDELSEEASNLIQHARQWLIIMGATTRAHYRIAQMQEKGAAHDALIRQIFGKVGDSDIRLIVETVFQYLLASWSVELEGGADNPNKVSLEYRSERGETLNARQAFDQLRNIVRRLPRTLNNTRYQSEELKVLHSEAIIWPIAVLREVVQNIRLDYPVADNMSHNIRFAFRWRKLQSKLGPLILETTQSQLQTRRFPSEMGNELPEGLKRANLVYGLEGAQFAEVQCGGLTQTAVKQGIFKIVYRLNLVFFPGGTINAASTLEGNDHRG